MTARFAIDELQTFVAEALGRYGVDSKQARTTAVRMLEADVRGQTAHGISRLPGYVKRLASGGYNVAPNIHAVHETPVSALIEGDNGLGHVVVSHAVDVAIDKAQQHGLAWVGTRGSNHAGAGGVYASLPLDHDMIGLYMAVGSANHVPPYGGVDLLLSTNPIAVAIPAGAEPPIVLDMATTVASYGKIKAAAARGETIPEGWLTDRSGRPITDPGRSGEGLLVPIGGYKGYGLGFVIGALAGVLNGAAFGSEVVDMNADFRTPPNTGQTIIVMRPDLFGPVGEFKARMDARIREIRTSTPMEGHAPVRLPGAGAAQRAAQAHAQGVALEASSVDRLTELAQRLRLHLPEPLAQ